MRQLNSSAHYVEIKDDLTESISNEVDKILEQILLKMKFKKKHMNT